MDSSNRWEWVRANTYLQGQGAASASCVVGIAQWEIPDDLWVLHRCDVPACVNPKHLFLGTLADNWADCVSKARSGRPTLRGEKNKAAKLTAENVADIRTKRMTQRAFGLLYGISHTTVFKIQHNKKWKDIADVHGNRHD